MRMRPKPRPATGIRHPRKRAKSYQSAMGGHSDVILVIAPDVASNEKHRREEEEREDL